jgi:oxalate decarboxylase/phosphoglucose isomerase-like protein (cupin superfamily)
VYVPPKSSKKETSSPYYAPAPSKASSAAPAPSGATTEAQELADAAKKVAEARLIPTVAERIALLENSEYEFDFVSAITGVTTGTAGHSVTASSLNFPALVGTGMSMTIGFLGPCGLNTPHTHPRGTELNYVVNGTLRTGFLMENGARFVFNDAHAGTVSVFPAGAIHFEQNDGCDPVMFVAAFNHEDAGVTAVAQRFFGLPPDIVGADLGGLTPEEVAAIEVKIPNNIALGADECLQRCGITRPALQLTSQQQGRNPGNALPAGFSSVSEAADLYPSTGIRFAESTRGQNAPPKSVAVPAPSSHAMSALGASKSAGVLGALGDESSGSTTFATSPVLIALVVVNGVFVIAALTAMVICLRRRSVGDKRGKYVQPSAFKPGMVEHQEYEDVPYSGTK